MKLATSIEAVLFSEGAPVSKSKLATLLKCKAVELEAALDELAKILGDRGVALIRSETEVALAVSPESSELIKKIQEEELSAPIGDAGLEILAILLYRGPSTKADIDYIRGVNSGFSIRLLLARGLVERIRNPEDSREFLYRPTVELLAHLGVRDTSELPERDTIRASLAAFEATKESFVQHESDQTGDTARES